MENTSQKIQWLVNGLPIGYDEWVCTQYVGRDRLYHFNFDVHEIALLTVKMMKEDFYSMMADYFLSEYEWIKEEADKSLSREQKLIKEWGYPSLAQLTGEKFFVVRNGIVGFDVDFVEMIWADKPKNELRTTYFLQRMIEVVENSSDILAYAIGVKCSSSL